MTLIELAKTCRSKETNVCVTKIMHRKSDWNYWNMKDLSYKTIDDILYRSSDRDAKLEVKNFGVIGGLRGSLTIEVEEWDD